jgi:hypothetical protein
LTSPSEDFAETVQAYVRCGVDVDLVPADRKQFFEDNVEDLFDEPYSFPRGLVPVPAGGTNP